MYGKKMMELRQNQKADVVLKQELDYCTIQVVCCTFVCTAWPGVFAATIVQV